MIIITKQPQIIREIRFGKYAGKTLEEIARMDREYLLWIAENMTDKDDLVWNVERVLNMDVTANSQGNLTWT
jgi:uncharacterized protein (DUF3820 family)